MPVEVALNTPLAEALNSVIQPKLQEVGWANDTDAGGLTEYIILMLVNGNTEEQIGSELASDFLNLPSDDPNVRDFSKWLFEQIDVLNAQLNGGQAADASQGAASGEMDTDMNANDVSELNAPTGPRSMRNGNQRGGRDKRMLGHMNKAMDRSADGALHRVRGQTGNERINTHGRGAMGRGGARGGRGGIRAANIQAGLAAGGPGGQWMMNGQQPNQMELMAMLEQQNQMMFQLSQQLMTGGGGQNQHHNRRGGKSLFERTNGNKNFRKGQNNNQDGASGETTGEGGEDVDMGGESRQPPNPDDTVCKYNLHCTNRECKFAHQSPAAPPGTSVDVNDNCSFGAACKNRKCVGRHPSPATRLAHQGEQDCKFFPNCHNPRCPFKHPSMPLCRNGADCTTDDCKFTHVKTKCKFNPCLNPKCAFQHDEGQQGGFKDKVWTAEGGEHVSERKFVEDGTGEETIRPDDDMKNEAVAQEADVIG